MPFLPPADGGTLFRGMFLRVLHVYSGNLFGGVETFLLTLARHRELCPRMEPHFGLCFDGRLRRELLEAGVSVDLFGPVRASRPWTVWTARRRMTSLLEGAEYDVAVCHSPWSTAVFGPAISRSGTPLVFWLHDILTGRTWIERWAAFSRPILAICDSRHTGRSMQALYPGLRTECLYYPVAPNGLRPVDVRSAIRAELDTPEDATVIIQASRMEPWKGHRLHLAALTQLRSRRDWILWMVGGAQRPEEEAYARELASIVRSAGIADRVRFTGQRNDVPSLMAAADIHCQPNEAPEPFGIAFVEALWSGLPVVSVAMGGALEIVDASCGLLVARDSPAELAEALAKLLDDPDLRRRLGGAGPRRAREICDPRVQMNRLHELLGTVGPARSRRFAATGAN